MLKNTLQKVNNTDNQLKISKNIMPHTNNTDTIKKTQPPDKTKKLTYSCSEFKLIIHYSDHSTKTLSLKLKSQLTSFIDSVLGPKPTYKNEYRRENVQITEIEISEVYTVKLIYFIDIHERYPRQSDMRLYDLDVEYVRRKIKEGMRMYSASIIEKNRNIQKTEKEYKNYIKDKIYNDEYMAEYIGNKNENIRDNSLFRIFLIYLGISMLLSLINYNLISVVTDILYIPNKYLIMLNCLYGFFIAIMYIILLYFEKDKNYASEAKFGAALLPNLLISAYLYAIGIESPIIYKY